MLVGLVFFFSLSIQSQEPNHQHYGIDDGLPSLEVYQSIQDEKGYMWFGTDKGLVRFDGYDFEVYTTKDGLVDNVVFGFHEDHNNRIWFYTYHGGIGYLEHGKIVIPPFNQKIVQKIKGEIISSMHVTTDGSIYIGTKTSSNSFVVRPDSSIEDIPSICKEHGYHKDFFLGETLFSLHQNNWRDLENAYITSSSLNDTVFASLLDLTNSNSSMCATKIGTTTYLARGKDLLALQDRRVKAHQLLPAAATMSLYTDRQQNLWVGMFSGGSILFAGGDLHNKTKHLLKGYTVTSIYEDQNGGYWFTTLKSGIFYSHNLGIQSVRYPFNQQDDYSLSSIVGDDSSLWLGTRNSVLIKQSRSMKEYDETYNYLNDIRFLAINKKNLYIGISNNDSIYSRNKVDANHHFVFARSFCQSRNKDTIWFSRGQFLPKEKRIENAIFSKNDMRFRSGASMCQWKGQIFSGNKEVLRHSTSSSADNWSEYPVKHKPSILFLLAVRDKLLIGSKEHGVLIHERDTTWKIDKSDGLLSNTIKKIVQQDDSTFWFGSQKGIAKAVINFNSKKVELQNIIQSNGLISNQVNDLYYDSDTLWVATNLGLSYFNVHKLKIKQFKPRLYINEVKVNNVKQANLSHSTFDHTQKAFSFKYSAINYTSGGFLTYKYRLKGFSNEWVSTQNREVGYALTPGKYQFEVMAKNSHGMWSDMPTTYTFEVRYPFWNRWWFYLITSIGAIAIILFGMRYRLNKIERENKLRLGTLISEQKALRLQLNPHFVFNSINSLLGLIVEQKNKLAAEGLSRFARLMRYTLDSSDLQMISLNTEVEMLRLYLELERLRFDKNFDYKIRVAEEIDLDFLQIPPMLIQPYVENALKHGLSHKVKGDKQVEINFSIDNDVLKISIRDNGVGRVAAAKIQEEEKWKKSGYGTRISEGRLSLLNKTMQLKMHQEITDLYSDNGNPIGTEVCLYIPQSE